MPPELDLQGGKSRKVVVKNDGDISSSDAGLVILSRIEKRRKWIKRLAGCFTDWRNQGLATYSLEGLLRQGVYGLAQGYEDLIDHDQWRHDPLLALACGGSLILNQVLESPPSIGLSLRGTPITATRRSRWTTRN